MKILLLYITLIMSITIFEEKDEFKQIQDPYIKKVFETPNHISMLTIKEFINVSGFPINDFLVDTFFNNLNEEIPIYINEKLIEWCGFQATDFKNKKMEFNRILQNFELGKDYFVYSKLEYSEFYESLTNVRYYNYPNPSEFKGKNRTKHIILTVNCFKMVLMTLNTPKTDEIKNGFLSIINLLLKYWKYQCIFYKLKFTNEIRGVLNMKHNKEITKLSKLREIDINLYNKHRVGVIYFITELDTANIVKIGYTYNLQNRLRSLQTAHYKILTIQKYYFTQYPHEEEHRLHKKYKKYKIRGEWFKIDICNYML